MDELRYGPSPSTGECRGADIASDEAEAKALLAEAGLPVPPGRRAANADEAVAAAATLGFPVALKALGIAHKSEHGAVRLNLRDEAAVRDAAEALSALGSGLYVERMVTGGVAELIVGITRDPIFGPVMTIGSGGVLVELLKDSATLLLPSTPRRHRGGAARPETVSAARRLSRPAEGRSRCGDRRDIGHRRIRGRPMPARSRSSTSIR